jgi:aliphatic sulfonates family ABC transporter substrate-binding protein
VLLAGTFAAEAADAAKEVRIGYQKNGPLLILKHQETLAKRLAVEGIRVSWVEFPSGPPLLEALNAKGIDFGTTGDTPPIFAQAGGTDLVYVGYQPSPGKSAAILVPKASSIATLTDLKGKRVAFTKGSSAHNVVVRVLEHAGLRYADIQPIYLSPADALAAFQSGSVDAWSIWDPFYALAEINLPVRVLTTAEGVAPSNTFFLADRSYATRNPRVIAAAIEEIGKAGKWAEAHPAEVAQFMADATGVALAAQRVTAERSNWGISFMDEVAIAQQQAIADNFQKLGLIPKPIAVRSAVWTPNS